MAKTWNVEQSQNGPKRAFVLRWMTVTTAMTMIAVDRLQDEQLTGIGIGPWRGMSAGDPPRGPGGNDDDGRTDLITKTKPKTKKPSLYKVLILNDDYTPMEFVVDVLERFFGLGLEDATRIMLHVHHKGAGICGVFTYEIAETKVTQVTDYSRQHQHPLQCVMEKE